jgi:methyl-accepting chemotaxis protein
MRLFVSKNPFRSFYFLFLVNAVYMGLFAFGVRWLTANGYAQGDLDTGILIGAGALISAAVIGLIVFLATKQSLLELKSQGESIADSIGHLVDASQSVSSASTEQAASIQETVSTVTEMSASIRKSAEYAEKSCEASSVSQRVSKEGQLAVEEMIKSMDQINTSNNTIVAEIENGYERITEIVNVITEISQKTKVINDIVFQTKLLSFNASVEAARAGEHGKGFAVVAEEIGNLAKMSGNASRDISVMLTSSIKTVNSIVQETSSKVKTLVESEKSKVDSGIQVARRCGEVLQEAVSNVSKVNTMVTEISKATQEQAQGMNEISAVMHQLDAVTQQNANTAHSAADYSANISGITESLRRTLDLLHAVLKPGASGPARQVLRKWRLGNKSDVQGKVLPFKPTIKHKKSKQERPPTPAKQRITMEASGSNVPMSEDPDFEDV